MFASIARAAVICGNEEAVTLNVKRARKILDEEADFSEAKLSSCSIHLSNVFFLGNFGFIIQQQKETRLICLVLLFFH